MPADIMPRDWPANRNISHLTALDADRAVRAGHSSRRDDLAAQILCAMIASKGMCHDTAYMRQMAEDAYEMAGVHLEVGAEAVRS